MNNSVFAAPVIAIQALLLICCDATHAEKIRPTDVSLSNAATTRPASTDPNEASVIQRERLESEREKSVLDRTGEKGRPDLERSKLKLEESRFLSSALSTIGLSDGSLSNAAGVKPVSTDPNEASAIQRERLELEKEKFVWDRAGEKEKLDLERSKLKIEESKVLWSALSTIVPLLGVLFTIVYSVWSFKKQSALQIAAQNESAKLNFEIKAAEIAFGGSSPQAVLNRGGALKAIFGNRLPEGFLTRFDPATFGGDKEAPEEKKFFLELLVKYPERKKEIEGYWRQLFPGDDRWLSRVKFDDQTKAQSEPTETGSPAKLPEDN
jgi:hypothetical protein